MDVPTCRYCEREMVQISQTPALSHSDAPVVRVLWCHTCGTVSIQGDPTLKHQWFPPDYMGRDRQ